MISLALPRTSAGPCARSPRAARVRCSVPPHPTGSSTHGGRRSLVAAAATARDIASRAEAVSAPMLMLTAAARSDANCGASSAPTTIAGAAPAASATFAMISAATTLGKHCTRGRCLRSWPTAAATASGVSAADICDTPSAVSLT
eukprot:scaffold129879_cov63-Phaeocystis_antarctica.AAC.4